MIKDETIWITQKAMGELGVEKAAISKHLKNIYQENELNEESTVSKMETVQKEGNRDIKRIQTFYNLDAIIAVVYRVNSKEATKFRIWATSILKEYIKKGFVLNIVAKNYLSIDEIKKLERLVSGYFDYVEDIIERENTFTMEEFALSVSEFINFRKYDVLNDKGKVTQEKANEKAFEEYDIFNKTQKLNSDFDKFIKDNKLHQLTQEL